MEQVASSAAAREYLDVERVRRAWDGMAPADSGHVLCVLRALAFGLFITRVSGA